MRSLEAADDSTFQPFKRHTREIASLSKKSACSAVSITLPALPATPFCSPTPKGRTAVNVSDVLQHVGDLNGLFEFFEQSCVEKRTLVGARTRTTSRKKSRVSCCFLLCYKLIHNSYDQPWRASNVHTRRINPASYPFCQHKLGTLAERAHGQKTLNFNRY